MHKIAKKKKKYIATTAAAALPIYGNRYTEFAKEHKIHDANVDDKTFVEHGLKNATATGIYCRYKTRKSKGIDAKLFIFLWISVSYPRVRTFLLMLMLLLLFASEYYIRFGKISSRCKAKPNVILCLDEKYVRHTRLLNFHSPFKSDNSNKRRIYWDNAHRIHFAATIILRCRKDVENITTTMQMQRVIIIWYTV